MKALEQYQKLLELDPLNASVYLNVGLLYQAMSNNPEAQRAFRQAILVETLNPKSALFFLAFLPQFVEPQNGAVPLQLAILGNWRQISCLTPTIFDGRLAGSENPVPAWFFIWVVDDGIEASDLAGRSLVRHREGARSRLRCRRR